MSESVKLVLGPHPFALSAEKLRDFYLRIADEAPVDTVHLGQIVCYRRDDLSDADRARVLERLDHAGKEAVVSMPLMVITRDERDEMARRIAESDRMIEINDLTAIAHVREGAFMVGPSINIYNEAALAVFAGRGAVRAALPPELPRDQVAAIAGQASIPVEVAAFGPVQLAVSSRCHTARAKGRSRDNCGLACMDAPEGLALDTLDGAPFLTINGPQTLSRECLSLLDSWDDLVAAGVRRVRLGPLCGDMVAVANIFCEVAAGRLEPSAGQDHLKNIMPEQRFINGFWHGVPGRDYIERGLPTQKRA
ncbi:MAG: U32 family peptidase [Pseudomonadota bacterium]|nr:U32 family peptidase [Pseudomonadota bacterium]